MRRVHGLENRRASRQQVGAYASSPREVRLLVHITLSGWVQTIISSPLSLCPTTSRNSAMAALQYEDTARLTLRSYK